MKKRILPITFLVFAGALFAVGDARQLFERAFSKGDKKARAQLLADHAGSEFVEIFRLYDSIPENFDAQKTPAVLKQADALIARAPEFDVAYFVRASLHFDMATHDPNTERVHAEAVARDIEKALSLGLAKVLPRGAQGVLLSLQCYADYMAAKYQSALKLCDAGIKADPNDQVIHKYRALTLYALEDYAAAVKSFNQVLKKDSDDTYILNLRGISRLQSQDFKGALADAQKGKKLDPNMVEFVILSGRAKIALKNRAGGCLELQSASAMGSGSEAYTWYTELCR